MILITKKEMDYLEEIRKEIHGYIGEDIRKYWRLNSLTSKLYRIVYRKRNFKWLISVLLKGK